MKQTILFSLTILLFGCNAQDSIILEESFTPSESTAVDDYFSENSSINNGSISHGSVSNGSITNSRLIPFSGENFHYFDSNSYLLGRAYSHEKVIKSILESFADLENSIEGREFCVMECSNQNGGELYPHRTHQNGLSIDFMMPKIKNGLPDYSLDSLGVKHYFLTFNNDGEYEKDPAIVLDFNTVTLQLLTLEKHARLNGLKIEKVIINTDLKDELFASDHGSELKESGIYIVQNLSKVINEVHDDHFHVDFKLLK